jgi:hypothetical protein
MAANLESHVFALVLIDSATADACATNQPYLTQQRTMIDISYTIADQGEAAEVLTVDAMPAEGSV